MRKYRGALFIAAALAVLATATVLYVKVLRGDSAHPSPALEILSQVPVGAPTLVYIDLAAIRESSFYRNRPDRSPLTVPDSDYAKFVQATGFDFEKDLDRVAIASWPQSLAQEPKKDGKLDRQQGHDVFLFPAQEPKGAGSTSTPNASSKASSPPEHRWNSLVFLDDHRIAMMDGSSIAPVLAPHVADAATDPVRERAARVDGAAAFVISRVPPIPDNFAPGGMQSAQLAGLVRSVQWITLAARPEGENLRVSLEGECQTGADARQMQSALETLRMFGQAALESPKTRQTMNPATFGVLETLLKTADITGTAERVRILVEITPDILKLSGPQKQR